MINRGREIELLEIKSISPKVFALIDSERSAAGNALGASREGFAAVCAKVRIACHVLERRAIENYLWDSAVKKVKGDRYRALAPYEKISEVSPAWSKAENWRIAREMNKQDLENTDLGAFLESV
jgi:hypothetical protein